MWYLDYYDYDTYNHEDPTNMEGWETHPVPSGRSRSQSSQHGCTKTGTLMGREVTFDILPPLGPDWRSSHRLVAVSQSDRFAMGLCSCGKVFIDGFFHTHDYEKKCDLVHWEGIKSIATGPDDAVGILADGRILIAGCSKQVMKKHYGSWKDIVQVSIGQTTMVGLKSDGTVLAGDDSWNYWLSEWRDIVSVSAGDYYVLGVRRDGTVAYMNDTCDEAFDCDVSGWTDIVQASAGPYHAVGLRRDGTVVVSECKGYYEFMDGVECLDVGSWHDVVQVCAGDGYTAGLLKDGSVMIAFNEGRGLFGGVTVQVPGDVTAISVNRHYEGDKNVLALEKAGYACTCFPYEVYPWDNWDAE